MKIVFMNYWFSEGMGYAENLLPSAVARLGHEVHLVTSDGQVYFDSPAYDRTYAPFLGPSIVPCGTRRIGDVTVHRLPRRKVLLLNGVRGLLGRLAALKPDIVQAFETFDLMALEAALGRPWLRYRLFLESHVHRSVLATPGEARYVRAVRWAIGATAGPLLSSASERCYAISRDAADVAHESFGIARSRIEVCSLGVDTTLFHPLLGEERAARREEQRRALGIGSEEVVCVYTGRFSTDKNPLLLAVAVERLRAAGKPFRALFVGEGPQADALRACAGSVVHPFVASRELPRFYWASDVGVWPKQESTSQLDAAACGLPVIIGDRAEVRDRVEGNGATYREDDAEDLARVLATMGDPTVRAKLGEIGGRKMTERYGWDSIARRRVTDYARALSGDAQAPRAAP